MARTCPSCGADAVADDAAHCHRCGTRLDAADASWPEAGGTSSDESAGDWRTAAEDAGVGRTDSPIPSPRDPHGPHAGGGPITKDSTTWAMGAHLSAFLGAWLALAFVGPLVVWLIKRDEDPFVERHAREALNFNLLLLILLAAGFAFALLTIGLGALIVVPVAGILAIVWIVLTIVAAVRASNGQEYSYPFNISLVK